MWGIFDKDEAERIIPEAHRHPHFRKDGADDEPASGDSGDTPEDHPASGAPTLQHQRIGGKGEAQASLRLQPFAPRRQEA
jgi:hypothetical protein